MCDAEFVCAMKCHLAMIAGPSLLASGARAQCETGAFWKDDLLALAIITGHAVEVPDSGATLSMLGFGLLGLWITYRFWRSSSSGPDS